MVTQALTVQIDDQLTNEIQEFLLKHGTTLKFIHAGIFRGHNEDGTSCFITDVFGRFSSEKSDIYSASDQPLIMDLNYLDVAERILKNLPSNKVFDPIKANAGPAIALAIHNCKTFRPHITREEAGIHLVL